MPSPERTQKELLKTLLELTKQLEGIADRLDAQEQPQKPKATSIKGGRDAG